MRRGNAHDAALPTELGAAMSPVPNIQDIVPPRLALSDWSSEYCSLPIRGGWGYTQTDACVVDRYHPRVNATVPFNGVEVERQFVLARLYEELIVRRAIGEKFAGIRWELLGQRLVSDGLHNYDHLRVAVTAFAEANWLALKEEFEAGQTAAVKDFDFDAHAQKREQLIQRFEREYWFDVTSFYGGGEGPPRTMPNSGSLKLINERERLFLIRDAVYVRFDAARPLPSVQPLEDSGARGGLFYLEGAEDSPYVLIADGTEDATEPDIENVDGSSLDAINHQLKAGLAAHYEQEGNALARWRPTM